MMRLISFFSTVVATNDPKEIHGTIHNNDFWCKNVALKVDAV